jgi:hypothetical protein
MRRAEESPDVHDAGEGAKKAGCFPFCPRRWREHCFFGFSAAAETGQAQGPIESWLGLAIALLLVAAENDAEVLLATEPLPDCR